MKAFFAHRREILFLNLNRIDVTTRRLGGGYGGKIFKGRGVAAAAAIAANALGKPIRMVLDIQTNMEAMGKRAPYLFNYSVSWAMLLLSLLTIKKYILIFV